jgi:hypothetical protein
MARPAATHSRNSLRSAWWVIGLALLVSGSLFGYRLWRALSEDAPPRVGDGRHVASYGFVLVPSLVPPEEIVAAGLPKDGLPALTTPPLLDAAGVDSLNHAERGKYLVAGDRVIGLALGGSARAYPLRVLAWHEITDDTLGGRPVAITYSPLCDACAAFGREVGGQVREFRVSGLLHDSNLLMYDRQSDPGQESLWNQLQARAVTGPAAAAGLELEVLPIAVVTWRTWRAWHPETTVPLPAVAMRESYKRSPYGSYYGSDLLRFPVAPLPPDRERPLKSRVIAVRTDRDSWRVYPLAETSAAAGAAESDGLPIRLAGDGTLPLRILAREDPAEVAVFDERRQELRPIIASFWFAWYATHPGTELVLDF